MLRIDRILAPIDFSEPAAEALRYARALAATYDARLDLLHVVEEPTFPAMYGAVMHELYGRVPDIREQALEALQTLLAEAEAGGPVVVTGVHVVKGHAAREILHFTETQAIDLVVIASRGLSGLEHLLLGSVAEKVVREATCPVFVVKSGGRSLLEAED